MRVLIFIFLFCLIISNFVFSQVDSNRVFELSRGKWSCPIENLKRVDKYEDYSRRCDYHGYNKSMIFISTKREPIKSVHDGRVVLVSSYDELNLIVVKYGHYFLCYANILNPKVKKGDWISAGKVIGELAKNSEDDFEFELILSLGQIDYDPATWFKKSCP